MEKNVLIEIFNNLGNFTDRLDCPNLIIYVHNAHQNRIGAQRFFNIFRINKPITGYFQKSKIKPALFKLANRLQNRAMLECSRDYMSLFDLIRDAENRQIVRFSSARYKDYFVRLRGNYFRDF